MKYINEKHLKIIYYYMSIKNYFRLTKKKALLISINVKYQTVRFLNKRQTLRGDSTHHYNIIESISEDELECKVISIEGKLL